MRLKNQATTRILHKNRGNRNNDISKFNANSLYYPDNLNIKSDNTVNFDSFDSCSLEQYERDYQLFNNEKSQFFTINKDCKYAKLMEEVDQYNLYYKKNQAEKPNPMIHLSKFKKIEDMAIPTMVRRKKTRNIKNNLTLSPNHRNIETDRNIILPDIMSPKILSPIKQKVNRLEESNNEKRRNIRHKKN